MDDDSPLAPRSYYNWRYQDLGSDDKEDSDDGNIYVETTRRCTRKGTPGQRRRPGINLLESTRRGPSNSVEVIRPKAKESIDDIINRFVSSPNVWKEPIKQGLDANLCQRVLADFIKICRRADGRNDDLGRTIKNIRERNEDSEVIKLMPFFLRLAKEKFPFAFLPVINQLRSICCVKEPHTWQEYLGARQMRRKIIFHAGPTNSGKTYEALKGFLAAESGVYCAPLRLLAREIFQKANDDSEEDPTPCDLITGEERIQVHPDGEQAAHVSCTVEMTLLDATYDVAVIDEIQMLRDSQRGWAWTRALLGVCAREVHVCGEESAVPLVKKLAAFTKDTFEVKKYKRLTPLNQLNRGVDGYQNIRPGDCIVCFSAKVVHRVAKKLKERGEKVAIIYGGLPPATKTRQADEFSDPKHPCKIMVATDAIAMGLNLNIKRIVFYHLDRRGKRIPNYMAQQIAGRAGRYKSQYEIGEVTTFRSQDLPCLKNLLSSPIENIKCAGLHPTQLLLERLASKLPKDDFTFENVIEVFQALSNLDEANYFMCELEEFKELAILIEQFDLQLKERYKFCISPTPIRKKFVCDVAKKIARMIGRNKPVVAKWLRDQFSWPPLPVKLLEDLTHSEEVYQSLDLYLWFSYRFEDMFPHKDKVKEMQEDVEEVISAGLDQVHLLSERQ